MMVYLEFVGIDGDEVTYDYMPQRKNAPRGRVSVNRITKKRSLIRKSSDDELSMYRGGAWRRIEQMIDSGDLKKDAYAALY